MTDRENIFALIDLERQRQQTLYGELSIAGNLGSDTKFRILGEEVGEVAQALDGKGNLVEELTQVAACAVAWMEAIARYNPAKTRPPRPFFCPRHGAEDRPIEIPGLRCDCGAKP